jgi:hypothetical protein
MEILLLSFAAQPGRAMSTMDGLGTEIFGAIQGNQNVASEPAESVQGRQASLPAQQPYRQTPDEVVPVSFCFLALFFVLAATFGRITLTTQADAEGLKILDHLMMMERRSGIICPRLPSAGSKDTSNNSVTALSLIGAT